MELITLLMLPVLLLYLLPTWIAFSNRHRNLTTVLFLNLLTGWSGIGWGVALMLALWPTQHNKLQEVISS